MTDGHEIKLTNDRRETMKKQHISTFLGPKKSRFSGPTPSNAPRNDVAPLKTITYHAIKTTGTLIVNFDAIMKISSYIPGNTVGYIEALRSFEMKGITPTTVLQYTYTFTNSHTYNYVERETH
jgi:hypothetical protein